MGNGFNYIREIMQMNLPETPVEERCKSMMKAENTPSKYTFVGYMDDEHNLDIRYPIVNIRERFMGPFR